MSFSYLKSLSASDEALFSGVGREVKTKQILVFAALAIIALILIHRSVILAIPFFVLGIIYMNYSDDIMPLTSYLSLLQENRKLTKKEQKMVVKKTKPDISIHIPIEIQLAGASILTLSTGFYGVYSSLNTLNVFGIVFGSVLIAIGIVILLALVTPFLNKVINEAK
jgi:hypothetical protein